MNANNLTGVNFTPYTWGLGSAPSGHSLMCYIHIPIRYSEEGTLHFQHVRNAAPNAEYYRGTDGVAYDPQGEPLSEENLKRLSEGHQVQY